MPNKSADKLVQFKGRSGVSVREEVLKVKSVNCSLTVWNRCFDLRLDGKLPFAGKT